MTNSLFSLPLHLLSRTAPVRALVRPAENRVVRLPHEPAEDHVLVLRPVQDVPCNFSEAAVGVPFVQLGEIKLLPRAEVKLRFTKHGELVLDTLRLGRGVLLEELSVAV